MTYLLDTCTCVELLHGNEQVNQRLNSVGVAQCCICEITWAELLFGIEYNPKHFGEQKQAETRQQLEAFKASLTVLPISQAIPDFAREKARLWLFGLPIEDEDIYIGCTARRYGLTLVTDNVKHMARIEGLRIQNWKA